MIAAHTKPQQPPPTLRAEQTPTYRNLRAKYAGAAPQSIRGNPALTNMPQTVLAGLTISPVPSGSLQAAESGVPVEGRRTKTPNEMLEQRYPNRNSCAGYCNRVSDSAAPQDRDPAGHRVVGCCGPRFERSAFTVIEYRRFAFQCHHPALGGQRTIATARSHTAHLTGRDPIGFAKLDSDSSIRTVADCCRATGAPRGANWQRRVMSASKTDLAKLFIERQRMREAAPEAASRSGEPLSLERDD